MAELLVLTEDRAGCSRGDIIHARENGTSWGQQECLDIFMVVSVDMSVDDAKALLGPAFAADGTLLYENKGKVDLDNAINSDEHQKMLTADWYVPVVDRAFVISKV